MTPSLAHKQAALEAAYRHSAALKAGYGRHACGVCGYPHAAFRLVKDGPWLCREHVERGADGLMREKPE